MSSLAERMIVNEMQEKSKIKQEGILSRDKKAREKKHEESILAMRSFSHAHIDNELFWKFIAYGYFACKTLALLILIGIFIFGIRDTLLFLVILFACIFLNRKFLKYI